jgi:imidazolonepropionase-like amidohydrolase
MGRISAFASGLLAAFAAGSSAAENAAPAPEQPPIALVGGLIRTQTDDGDFVGTVVVRGGKIVAVGKDVPVPADAVRIDVSKCVITPGLIDARGVLGLNVAAAKEGGRDGTLNILDAVDPYADDWRDAARQGVTAVYVQPAASGTLGGSGAVLRVGPTISAEALAVRPQAGVQAALGAAPPAADPTDTIAQILGRRGGNIPPGLIQQAAPAAPPASNSLTRYAQYETLRASFELAKRSGDSANARRDIGRTLVGKAVRKELPVFISVAHEDDLRNATKLGNDLGLRLVFDHIDRAKTVPEEFAAGRFPLVVGPFLGAKASGEVRKLALDGRKFAIGTFGDEPRATAGLRLHAASAVAAGYPRDRVLRAMTADAAELLGAGDQLGKITAGRPADLVVFAGDPLDPSAPVRLTVCQGVTTYEAPGAEVAPAVVDAKPTLPEVLPAKYVIKTNRLLTPSGEFAPGELYIEAGRLSDRATANGSAGPVFDLGDAPVTPGLVSAHVAVNGETSPDADAAHLYAADGLSTDDSRLRSLRDGGFLTAVAAPGSANVIAGVAGLVRGSALGDIPDVGMKFVLTASARDTERYPVSLAGQVELIGQRLAGVPSHTDLYLPPAVRDSLLSMRDKSMEAVRDRRLPAYFEAHTRAEARAALRLATEYKLRGVLLMPQQVEELADEIQKAGVGVVIGPVKPQEMEPVARGLASLGKAGVNLAFGGGSAAEMRSTASWLVNAGMPRPTARVALTAQPAVAFGLPAGTGRLGFGDAADFVVWTGDPIDATSKPVAVVALGQRLEPGADEMTETKGERRPTTPAPRTRRR